MTAGVRFRPRGRGQSSSPAPSSVAASTRTSQGWRAKPSTVAGTRQKASAASCVAMTTLSHVFPCRIRAVPLQETPIWETAIRGEAVIRGDRDREDRARRGQEVPIRACSTGWPRPTRSHGPRPSARGRCPQPGPRPRWLRERPGVLRHFERSAPGPARRERRSKGRSTVGLTLEEQPDQADDEYAERDNHGENLRRTNAC